MSQNLFSISDTKHLLISESLLNSSSNEILITDFKKLIKDHFTPITTQNERPFEIIVEQLQNELERHSTVISKEEAILSAYGSLMAIQPITH